MKTGTRVHRRDDEHVTGTVLRLARDWWSGTEGYDVLWDETTLVGGVTVPRCTGWMPADRLVAAAPER